MVFSSLTFVFAFLPVFFLLYYAAGRFFGMRGKNVVLFIISLLFYSWGEPVYFILMIYSTVLDYTCGLMIGKGIRENNGKLKKGFLWVSMIGNLGLLFIFKYLGFATLTISNIFGLDMGSVNIALPIGISFYTFQTMSYSIDVYRGEVEPQKDIVNFGAYVVMFPQLIAGPVVRYTTVAEELNNRRETLDDFAVGLRRFIVGFGKKTVIANIMAASADKLFAESAANIGTVGAWIAIVAYTLQIFFDFSGYSDMAIGMGRMMGFHYLENFNYPYIARSITDFWRRWHISMSTFFRDYVYIPLGGNRVSRLKWLRNVLVVWFLTGLWHGSAWNFVLWGLYFGVILVIEKLFLHKLLDRSKVLCHVYSVFLILFGWVIFRCESLSQIGEFSKALFGGYGALGSNKIPALTYLMRADVNTVFFIVLGFGILFSTPIAPFIGKKLSALFARLKSAESGKTARLAVIGESTVGAIYDIILLIVFLIGTAQLAIGAYNPFIYFRF